MTAPARVNRDAGGGPATRTRARTGAPARERGTGKPASGQPDRAGARGRSAAAERAYTRRAQRTQRDTDQIGPKTERKPGSASRVGFVVLIMALLIGGVVATLWFATQSTADAYRLEQARKSTGDLSVQVDQLRQKVAAEDSAPSLAARARQLGMVPAGDPAHLVVGPNGLVTVVGTPTAVTSPPPPTTAPPPTSTTINPAAAAPPAAASAPASVTTPTTAVTTVPTPPAGG